MSKLYTEDSMEKMFYAGYKLAVGDRVIDDKEALYVRDTMKAMLGDFGLCQEKPAVRQKKEGRFRT